jgi:hypothetical protein
MEGTMKNLIVLAVGISLIVIPAIAQEPKVDKYCVHLMWGTQDKSPIGDDFGSEFSWELERVLFQSEKYVQPSHEAAPALRVVITLKMIDREASEGMDSPESAALSVAYIFFPGSIDFYAYSNCWLLDREGLEAAARILDREVEAVYAVHYHRAEDMKRIYYAHVLAEKAKTEGLKKKGDL